MSKRVASKQLTHDNWDMEDESEEPGTFKRVGASALANRVIRKAKRSTSAQPVESASSPFAKFAGFSSSVKSNSFTFVPKEKTDSSTLETQHAKRLKQEQNGSNLPNVSTESELKDISAKTIADPLSNSGKKIESRDLEYYRQLRALNESVFRWIESHLSKNPLCDFTPVFDDYRKHLESIEKKFPLKAKLQGAKQFSCSFPFNVPYSQSHSKQDNVPSEREGDSSSQPVSKLFKFEVSNASAKSSIPDSLDMVYGAGFASNTTNTSTFSFGIKDYSTATVSGSPLGPASSSFAARQDETSGDNEKPSFTFSLAKKPSNKGASRGSPEALDSAEEKKTFSFATKPSTGVISIEQDNNGVSEDEEYEPPKTEVTEVSEKDFFYSKRCKLFYKRKDSYVEKGVGTLFLKSLEAKTQLVIRADTSLGNILLNIILNASLPMQRMGKNNVLIVCVPNPPVTKDLDPEKTIPFLIRVKTGEEADELFSMLNKHKS